jgi:hypothetical protein
MNRTQNPFGFKPQECRSPAAAQPFAVNACYSVSAVSGITGESIPRIRRLCRLGRIKARRCGGYIITGWAIQEYLTRTEKKRN